MLFERLSERHLPLVDAFSCVESSEYLSDLGYLSEAKRRILKHSKDMDAFLKNEALHEQEIGMSTTFLCVDDEGNKVLGYVTLCNDAIRLELEERENAGITYGSAPAVKIARLAVDFSEIGNGIGKQLIEFSAYQSLLVREHTGVFFITLDCYEHRLSFYETVGFVKNLIQSVQLPYDSPISMRIGLDAYLETIQ